MTVVVGVFVAMCISTALSAVGMGFVEIVLMKVKQAQQHQHEHQTCHNPGHGKIYIGSFAERGVGDQMKKSHA